jgi:hypothetical protein
MKKLGLIGLLLCLSTSCSVIMAAKKEGHSVSKVQSCRTRGQMVALASAIVSSERLPSGELVEVYQILKERGSAARALMHGVLDVGTCGLWEVVGTPMEACINEKEYFTIKVFYNEQEVATKVELL